MAVSDVFLQELKYRCDIETIVSKYVNLRKSGRSLVGLCPFHSEKTPSFHVFPENQSFYCFGCETGGDVITFVRKIENLDYVEALKFLAQQAGIEMPVEGTDDGMAAFRSRIMEINRKAALFYYHCLISPNGAKGREYLKNRKLTAVTIKNFGLGYAPDSWDALTKYLKSEGYKEDEIKACALCGISRRGTAYDLFRNRVMFPIIDLRGNVIAFGGRVLDDSKPKYLNSNDTPVFKKSRCLFALNFAKNGNNNTVILCEGYMDAIALHQAGFTNAVATLGTALTPEQSRLMARYAKEVIISYDSDSAGQKAAQRAIGLLTAAGLSVRVLKIEGGKDPDEFIKTHGADKFRLMLEKSGNHIEYRLNTLLAKYNVEDVGQKAAYLKEAAAVLATVESSMEREVYAGKLAETLGISKSSILEDVSKLVKRRRKANFKSHIKDEVASASGFRNILNPEKSKYLKAARAEENLIVLLYKNPDFLKHIDGMIKPEDFITAFNRRLYESIRNTLQNGECDLTVLGQMFSAEEMGKISALLLTRQVSNTIEEARDCIDVLLQENLNQQIGRDKEKSAEEIIEVIKNKRLEEKKKTGGSHS